MNYLGIDLGKKKTGIAISEGQLATPLKTIHHTNKANLISIVNALCKTYDVKTLVVGFVEGKNLPYFNDFANKIKELNSSLNVILFDETLSTRQARSAMSKLNVQKTKKKELEDQFAAAFILQSYLDEK